MMKFLAITNIQRREGIELTGFEILEVTSDSEETSLVKW